MPEKSLSARLAEARGQPFEYEGHLVRGSHRVEVLPGDVVVVHFVKFTNHVRQALRMSLKKGTLFVRGQRMRELILWTDTAAETVQIDCHPPKKGATLHIWNAWEREGMLYAWFGNSGVLVDESGDSVILRCSDGIGPPDFQDLVVELKFVRPLETDKPRA